MTAAEVRVGNFLKNLPFFAGLPEADVGVLLTAGACRSYQKNQHLFLHGDRAEKFFVVISGCIKLYSTTEGGEESVIALLTKGDTVGEASIFDGAIHPFSASVAENAEVYEIRADIFKQRAKESTELTARIMALMSHEVLGMQREKERLASMSAAQRVGCMLLRLSAGMIGKGGTFTLPYDKSLAAANLGMKPETFSRALKELQPYGVTARGSEITIESFEHLAEYSCAHCSAMRQACEGDKRSFPHEEPKRANQSR
ncbi:MAG TPA: hypothetical protein DEA55_10025 [Rhodospirillaceae bacterium]|nr:hypothetical protein [Rhodospirillaceae bacterium]